MLPRSTRWRSAAGLALAVGFLGGPVEPASADRPGPSAGPTAKRVRVFAVGPKLELAWMESRRTYRQKMFALFDRRLRGRGRPRVQRRADDVASHLLGPSDPSEAAATARDLVAWPEDVGLFAALTGPRAAAARASTSLEVAVATLLGVYGRQIGAYRRRYPTAARGLPTRLLALALTDTFGRVAVETFSAMADRYDVYLEAGVNMARDWRIVCADRSAFNRRGRLPGRVRCAREDPARVAELRDSAEPTRDYAYEATTPDAVNMALVFDPDGRIVTKQVKTYITPVELGPTEDQVGLDLVPGRVSGGLGVVRTPVGRLGFVTSKDAWMPDVVQKLDQRHVDVLVQPEFFVGNTVSSPGMWNPDVLLASGYNDVLRHPSIEVLVLPELVGNVQNFPADHQQAIALKPRRAGGGGFLVGQPRQPGLVEVSPWVVRDPARRGEPFAERRARLRRVGARLLPGSGVRCPSPAEPGPCENGQVEGVLWREVRVARRPRLRPFRGPRARTRFGRSRPVHRAAAPQRNVAVALRGRSGVVAFEARRAGRDRVLLARTGDGGRTWSRPLRPTGRRRSGDEWWPAVALGRGGRVTVAWVARGSGRARVLFARSEDGGRSFGQPRALDPGSPRRARQWRPTLAQGSGDTIHAAFVDERSRFADGGIPQAGIYYTRIRAGAPEPARRLDVGVPVPLARKLDNAWAPSVAARGPRVLVSWVDFQNYDWDVFARESADGGASFGAQVPVNDTPADDEALNDTPRAAYTSRGPLVAWTDWRKRDSAAADPHPQYDIYAAAPGARNRQVDPYGGRQLSTFAPATCGLGRDLLVGFQDASRGQNDIRMVRLAEGETRGRALRVDDVGRRGGNAWRPQIACSTGRVLAVWEDERDGPPQIYAAAARASRLR